MTKIDDGLIDILCGLFGEHYRAIITENTTMQDIKEWDSMTFLNVIMDLEKAYGISIGPNDAVRMTSVKGISEVLSEKKAA